jgi:hypothetical protein
MKAAKERKAKRRADAKARKIELAKAKTKKVAVGKGTVQT